MQVMEYAMLGTLMSLLNATAGIGILSVSFALSQGGWLSLISLFAIGAVSWYTASLLQRCADQNTEIKSYADIGYDAYGWRGRAIVSLICFLELYLVVIEFLIIEGDNLQKLFPTANIDILGLQLSKKKQFVILAGFGVLFLMFFRSLLTYVSTTGFVSSLVLLLSIIWTGIDTVGFHEHGRIVHFSGILTASSMHIFCYGGHAVYPTIYSSMTHKKLFARLLATCFLLCGVIYGTMAITGYLMFGGEVTSQVTLNLPSEKLSSKIAIYTTLINPLAKYPLMISPVANSIEGQFRIAKRGKKILIVCLIRTLLVLSTVVVATTFPFFGVLMAFIGSFLSTMVTMVFPCLCFLKIFNRDISKRELLLVWCILVLGVLFSLVATYSSLSQIVKQL